MDWPTACTRKRNDRYRFKPRYGRSCARGETISELEAKRVAKSEVEIAQPMAKPISCEQSLIDIYARRKKERRLPKSCIFFEVALAQVLGRDKPVLQMHLIIKTRSTDSSTLE